MAMISMIDDAMIHGAHNTRKAKPWKDEAEVLTALTGPIKGKVKKQKEQQRKGKRSRSKSQEVDLGMDLGGRDSQSLNFSNCTSHFLTYQKTKNTKRRKPHHHGRHVRAQQGG